MNRPTLFISDLHLDPEARPETVALFEAFLRGPARAAAALYILGDLFEAWVGDDDDLPEHVAILDRLRALADSGVPTAFVAGNRDFLAGAGFAARSGCRLLDDPTVITLHGVPVLLAHGDRLCTDDTEFMAYRARMDDPAVRAALLAQPLDRRRAQGRAMRQQSELNKQDKDESLMDVNAAAVAAALAASGARLLIHGHTHRPALHGRPVTRAVLGDWQQSAVILSCSADRRLELLRIGPGLATEVVEAAPLPIT